jgi:multidrug efflux pump subunit AcrA (membrane-fusion protein)
MEIARFERLKQELEETQTLARVAWRTSQEVLAQCADVKAPIGGTILECQVVPGEWVSAGDVLLRIIQTDRVKVLLWIPPVRLADGDQPFTACIRQTGEGNQWVTAETIRISDLPHPRTGQFLAEIEIDNRAHRFGSGRFVEARVTPNVQP